MKACNTKIACVQYAIYGQYTMGIILSEKFSVESRIFGLAASRVDRKGPSFLSRLEMIIDVEVNLMALLIDERFWRKISNWRIFITLWAKSWFGKAFVPLLLAGPSCQRFGCKPQLPGLSFKIRICPCFYPASSKMGQGSVILSLKFPLESQIFRLDLPAESIVRAQVTYYGLT